MIAHSRTKHQLELLLADPAHAIGVIGERGAGKGFIAHHIAETIIGKKSPYIKIADASAPKFGIDNIRELQKFLTLTVPGTGTLKRALIIEHIDHLGHEAQNALLKTLEEPPADTIIIVTFARDTSVLDTIHSRLREITILPISMAEAEAALPTIDPSVRSKAFHMSGGQVGLLTALIDGNDNHELLQAISSAREILGLSRYQRLTKVDALSKNASIPPLVFLDGLYRLLDAGYRQAVRNKPQSELKGAVQRMRLVESAISDIDSNVQPKLVLTRLFMEL